MTISFSRSLYLPEAVQSAALAYGGVAKVEISVNENDIVASLEALDADGLPDEVDDAFANHVLFETIIRDRRQVIA